MKSPKYFFTTLLLVITQAAFSQNVYPEATNHCYLDQFLLESDSIIAKLDKEKIVEAITGSWDSKIKDKIEGIIGLQVLVDNRGNSCLVSYRNDTNQKTKKLSLEASVNDNLKWPRQPKKVSAIIVLEFQDGEIIARRMGTQDYVNLVELNN